MRAPHPSAPPLCKDEDYGWIFRVALSGQGWKTGLPAHKSSLGFILWDALNAEFVGAILVRLQCMFCIQCKYRNSDATQDMFYLCLCDNAAYTSKIAVGLA